MVTYKIVNHLLLFFSVPEEATEETKPKLAPAFVTKPEPFTVTEGEMARFCCRVTGHPKPRVMWVVNGHTVVNVSVINLSSHYRLFQFCILNKN